MPWEEELHRLDEDREEFREFDEGRPLPADRLTLGDLFMTTIV